ncbi:MAG: DNA polymerase I, partial [Treponema bryantii]|nr:DNA polymerase I [Treponema bryantii]
MKNKLFLIDAYALIYRSYYAFIKNPRFNSKGFNTSAILGFVNVLEEILKTESPSHIAVAFDPSGPTFRHEAYEEYKAQREATPEDIKLSVPIIKQIVAAYNIPILEVPGFEADDVIGTISKLAEQSDFNVYMLTPDKDYAQLVSDKVFIYRPRHGGGYETLDVQGVKDKWGISSPAQVIDLLGLMGDSSDNIPGCPGVGEKTAVKLLNDFNSIDNLLNSTDSLKGALKQKIIDNCEKIKFSKFLATIRTDVPIEFEPEKFILASPNVVSLCELFSELEFKSLLKKYSGDKKSSQKVDLQPSLFDEFLDEDTGIFKYSNLSELNLSKVKYQLIDNQKDMDEFLLKISTQDFFCFDVETTGISPYSDDLVGISFSWVKNEAYFIFLPVDREEAEKFLHQLKPIFNDVSKLKIGQNL